MKRLLPFAGLSFVMGMVLASAASAAVLTVGQSSPTSATLNTSQSYSASYTGTATMQSCVLLVDGDNEGNMSLSGNSVGTASKSFSFDSTGAHTMQVRCTDVNGSVLTSSATTVNVAAAASPTVGSISPTAAVLNANGTLSANYSGSTAIMGCDLYVDGTNRGAMNVSGTLSGTASKSFAFTSTGSHMVYARCTDSAGNSVNGASASVVVSASADTTVPSRPLNLIISTPTSDNTPSFSWSASSDNMAVTSYEIQIDGGAFAPAGNVTSFTVNALADGSHTFGVRARDAEGNVSQTATVNFSVSTGATPAPGPTTPPFLLPQLTGDADLVFRGATRTELESNTGRGCEFASSTATARVAAVFGSIANANARAAVENFIGCGTLTTRWLGAGERIGILNSYRAAFGRLPSTAAEWNDVVKIGNGRFTAETSASAEAAAKVSFRKVYLRDANMNNERDRNAVMIMAYGLRPLPRNLNAEAAAIVTFKAVYGRDPSSAQDWDVVRATAYSGATR